MTLTLERIRALSDKQLRSLSHSLHSPTKTPDLIDAVQAELMARAQYARDAAEVPVRLKQIAQRLRGDEPVAEMSEAEQMALVLYRPGSPAARTITTAAYIKAGKPVPRLPVERRKLRLPPEPDRSPDRAVPAQGAATAQARPTAPAKPVLPSNVVPFPDLFLPKVFGGSGTGRPVVWTTSE